MNRRTLLKLVALFPLVGPAIARALVQSNFKTAPKFGPYLPASFPKWDRGVDGLEEAGRWATEIERSRLPPDIVSPRIGQVWESVRDCEVPFRPCFDFQPHHLAGNGGPSFAPVPWKLMIGATAQLGSGERVRVLGLDELNKPLHVSFQPIRYEELHARIVPEDVRRLPGYVGYELSVKTAKTIADFDKHFTQTYFNEAFRLIQDVDCAAA